MESANRLPSGMLENANRFIALPRSEGRARGVRGAGLGVGALRAAARRRHASNAHTTIARASSVHAAAKCEKASAHGDARLCRAHLGTWDSPHRVRFEPSSVHAATKRETPSAHVASVKAPSVHAAAKHVIPSVHATKECGSRSAHADARPAVRTQAPGILPAVRTHRRVGHRAAAIRLVSGPHAWPRLLNAYVRGLAVLGLACLAT